MHATTPTGARRATPPMMPPGAERGGGHDARASTGIVELLADALGVAAEAGTGLRHLHLLGDPQGGAGLGLHQRHELGEALVEQVGRPVQQRGPLARAWCATTPGRRRPPRLRRPPRRRPRRRSGAWPDDLLGGRVDDGVGAVAAVDPLAADQQAVGQRRDRTARRSGGRGVGVGHGCEGEVEHARWRCRARACGWCRRRGGPSASGRPPWLCGQVLSRVRVVGLEHDVVRAASSRASPG